MEHQTPKTKLYLVGRKRPFYLVDEFEKLDGMLFDHHTLSVTQTDGSRMSVPYDRVQSVVDVPMPEVPEPDEKDDGTEWPAATAAEDAAMAEAAAASEALHDRMTAYLDGDEADEALSA